MSFSIIALILFFIFVGLAVASLVCCFHYQKGVLEDFPIVFKLLLVASATAAIVFAVLGICSYSTNWDNSCHDKGGHIIQSSCISDTGQEINP